MKRKLKFIGLLMLSWVLLINSTANATIVNITTGNLDSYSYEVGSGTVGIVNITSAPGTFTDLSLKLIWPTKNDDAGIRITDLGNPTVSSISDWNYWVKAPGNCNPHLTIFIDTDEDGSWDTEASVRTNNAGYRDRWLNINSLGTIRFWIEPKYEGGYSKNWTWSEFQTEFGDAVVEEIRISHYGFNIGNKGITAYIDDFSFGDTDYVIGVPEPTTIVLLGFGSIFLLRSYRKKFI